MKRSVKGFVPILIVLFAGSSYLLSLCGSDIARLSFSAGSAIASEGLGETERTVTLTAKSKAQKSKDFQLSGQDGILSPVDPGACCAGTLSVDLSGTSHIAQGALSMNITAASQADPLTNCDAITGSGSINNGQFTVELFAGELCGGTAHPVRYTLTGTVGIYAGTGECPGVSGQPQTAIVGTLIAYGAVHVPGNSTNPIPGTASSLVSIVGQEGSIPLCVP